jgi:hypothetical protein
VSEVHALHPSAILLWCPDDDHMIPIRRLRDLEPHLSAWRAYGHIATIHVQPTNGRDVRVTGLGTDGWVVQLHDPRMSASGWRRHRTLTSLHADGSLPTWLDDSPWYAPDETSDLAGRVFIAEQIHVNSGPVAQAIWSWLTAAPLPDGYAPGSVGFESVRFTTASEALEWISVTTGPAWPAEACEAVIELAQDLKADRVLVTSPSKMTLRVRHTPRRVRVQYRASSSRPQVRAVGMTDELGHEYAMSLPGKDIQYIRQGRSDC